MCWLQLVHSRLNNFCQLSRQRLRHVCSGHSEHIFSPLLHLSEVSSNTTESLYNLYGSILLSKNIYFINRDIEAGKVRFFNVMPLHFKL